MRIKIALPWLTLVAILVAEHVAFVGSCTDRTATSPWCMPRLSVWLDVVLAAAAIILVIHRVRRNRLTSRQ